MFLGGLVLQSCGEDVEREEEARTFQAALPLTDDSDSLNASENLSI